MPKTSTKGTFMELSGKFDIVLFFEIETEVEGKDTGHYTIRPISGKTLDFPENTKKY